MLNKKEFEELIIQELKNNKKNAFEIVKDVRCKNKDVKIDLLKQYFYYEIILFKNSINKEIDDIIDILNNFNNLEDKEINYLLEEINNLNHQKNIIKEII